MNILFPDLPGAPSSKQSASISFVGVAIVHGALLSLLVFMVPTERLTEIAKPMMVRLVALTEPKSEKILTPATPPKERPQPVKSVTPPPILAVAKPATESPSSFTVAPQSVAPPAPLSAPPAEVAVTAVRFDADYLHNPKPVYPAASRRLGEQGKVVLRVHVGADGSAEKVELKTSSGFARLDASAQDAVSRWRFVPARRGDQPVAAWVLVPIAFNLDS